MVKRVLLKITRGPPMFATKHIPPLVISIALTLGGCGTYVPEIQEIPGNQADSELLVNAIVGSIRCELKDAVAYIINYDAELASDPQHPQPRQADWLLSWGAQLQISLTEDEQSTLSPSGLWSPMKIFFLALGGTLSSEATRINTVNYYNTISDIYGKGDYCPQSDIAERSKPHPMGSLLIQSDLKLKEWLTDVVLARGTHGIDFSPSSTPFAKNAITHQVTFKVLTSGNITPMWKLVDATINPSGTLFAASRTRTHDLLITLGPNVQTLPNALGQTTNSLGANTPAAGTFLAAQIGLAIRNQMINSGLSP
jgi:hypothetical protein